MAKAEKAPSRKKLDELIQTAEAKRKQIVALEAKHEAVFTKHRELGSDLEGVMERIKLEARKLVEEGQSRTLHSDGMFDVSVVAGKKPVIFDYEAAEERWHEDELNEYRIDRFDPEKIERALADGKLKLKDLEGIRKYGDAPTPRVTLKWLS